MFFNTLSGRFLGLTIAFVLIAEVLIFVPAVSRFRVDYLQGRLELAQLAALALLATEDESVAPDLEGELLDTAEVLNVVLRRDEVRELVLSRPIGSPIAQTYDLRNADPLRLMRDAVLVFFSRGERIIRVVGSAQQGAASDVEITIYETPLRQEMFGYGLRILYLSLALTISLASLLFLTVQHLIVQPMHRFVQNMTLYREDPEDTARIIEPVEGAGAREVQLAETALHDLQVRLTASLRQKERLAVLGNAVAKISHDLRNILTTAQLLTDRIEMSRDPAVRRTSPKLVGSLARAISLCERTLAFGKAEEPPPLLADADLAPLVQEVLENERAAHRGGGLVEFRSDVPEGLKLWADSDQIFRVLTNLVRNAGQAIEAVGRSGVVTVTARQVASKIEIRVTDTGPGLPAEKQKNLFDPFKGSTRFGGSGLGLAIAYELVKGHRGSLRMEATGPGGTSFVIELDAV